MSLNGKNITAMDEEGRAAVRAKDVGFVFQSFHLLPGLTALENVALPLELNGGCKGTGDSPLLFGEGRLKSSNDPLSTTGFLGVSNSAWPRSASLCLQTHYLIC